MTLGVEVLVQWVLLGAGRVVGDDRESSLLDDGLAEVIGVLGGVGHDDLGGEAVDQRAGLGCVALLPSGETEPHRAAQPSDSHVDLGA